MQEQKLSTFLQCLKQLGNHSSPRDQLKPQFASLSKSYQLAQSKIVELENSLMQQTMFGQRQNSIIQLLKYALNGQMDDTSIFSFLKSLEKDLAGDSSLSQTLEQIERVLENKQRKITIEKQGKIVETSIKCEELQASLHYFEEKVLSLEKELQLRNNQVVSLKQYLKQSKNELAESKILNEQITKAKNIMQNNILALNQQLNKVQANLKYKNDEIIYLKETLEEYTETITECNQNWRKSQSNSQIFESKWYELNKIVKQLESVLGKDRSQMKNKLDKLVKNYKYLKFKHSQNKQNHKSLLCNSMKQFMSLEALELVQQIQQNVSGTYLFKELQELCQLEKQKLEHYKSQEREVRRCKIELIRLHEGDTTFTSRNMSSKSRCKDLERTGKFNQTSEFRL